MKRRLAVLLLVALLSLSTVLGQSGVNLQPDDSMHSVLQRYVGQNVELRMSSGEKLGGKLEKVSDKLVHLSQLTGAEYFEAIVSSDDIAAVVVRAKKN